MKKQYSSKARKELASCAWAGMQTPPKLAAQFDTPPERRGVGLKLGLKAEVSDHKGILDENAGRRFTGRHLETG